MATTDERPGIGGDDVEVRVSHLETEPEVRTSENPKLHPIKRFRELWRYREILVNLTRKEVKVKYTSSVLGSAWSMLNPLMYLLVFTFVFEVVLKSGIPNFPIYLLSGLLAWNVFSGSLTLSARSVVDNANLVKKVYFPREVLPLSSVGATIFDFLLQGIVLIAFMLVERYFDYFGWNLLLLPISMIALVLFSVALSLWVGALNVRYRDTQHLLNLALLTWFWLTPIVYPMGYVQKEFLHTRFGETGLIAYLILNPMATIIAGFQRALYGVVYPYSPQLASDPNAKTHHVHILLNATLGQLTALLGIAIAISLVLILVFWRVFFRQSGDFAEEL
jgi:ABC-2 type transport system permease protein